MSVKTIYTCDMCKKEQYNNTQFWIVGVVAYIFNSNPGSYIQPQHKLQVCRPCLETLGVYVQKRKIEEKQPEVPTIEELIKGLIDDSFAER